MIWFVVGFLSGIGAGTLIGGFLFTKHLVNVAEELEHQVLMLKSKLRVLHGYRDD
jgi:hypothetical protein